MYFEDGFLEECDAAVDRALRSKRALTCVMDDRTNDRVIGKESPIAYKRGSSNNVATSNPVIVTCKSNSLHNIVPTNEAIGVSCAKDSTIGAPAENLGSVSCSRGKSSAASLR
ncbi:unnamed protein product, partial [Choristocarpus tenellus]